MLSSKSKLLQIPSIQYNFYLYFAYICTLIQWWYSRIINSILINKNITYNTNSLVYENLSAIESSSSTTLSTRIKMLLSNKEAIYKIHKIGTSSVRYNTINIQYQDRMPFCFYSQYWQYEPIWINSIHTELKLATIPAPYQDNMVGMNRYGKPCSNTLCLKN